MPALTSMGMKEPEMELVAGWIDRVCKNINSIDAEAPKIRFVQSSAFRGLRNNVIRKAEGGVPGVRDHRSRLSDSQIKRAKELSQDNIEAT